MSKHFFYNYKDELQIKLSKIFRKELQSLEVDRNNQAQLDVAHNLIERYYHDLEESLKDIMVVSKGKIKVIRDNNVIVKFVMYDNYVKYTRFEQGIEVEIGNYDPNTKIVEARINSNIIPSEKRCIVKKIGKIHDGAHFDENTINYYMNEAFSSLDLLND
ncbi:MAG: hypothetical protein JXR88_10340 [Clostridia bacterium]|nr:hypothetical protein [Clostridia bacterium]